jgi:RND superfamily putative drug exporter
VSADGRALLIVLELTTEFLSRDNWPTVTKVEDLVRDLRARGKLPPGVDVAVTGSAVIGRDRARAQLQSARATEVLTVVLVIVLLVVIYRAPLLALIPLATVVLAVKVALSVLALLAQAGLVSLFQGVQIYVTILSYGAGVDYCLFLTARYKEELDRGAAPGDAVAAAVGGVGGALVASAATVACGIAMMLFADFGKFREAGLAIPLSLVLVLAATLTFSPALLRLAGRWAFWPRRPGPAAPPAPAAARPWFLRPGVLRDLWDRVGRALVRRPGVIWLTVVAVMAPFAVAAVLLYDHLSYDLISDLPADASSVAGTKVLQEHFPAGILGTVTVLVVNPEADFETPEGRAVVERLTARLCARRQELDLADVRSLTAPLGVTPAAENVKPLPDVPMEMQLEGLRKVAHERYNTSVGEAKYIGTRLDLILAQSPFTRRSITDLDRIEEAIRAALPAGWRAQTRVYALGTTASVRDLATAVRGDRFRIEVLVLASVLIILVLLLRRLVVPAYLLLSVLFSYYATLGVTFAVFWLLDPGGFVGIDWKVAVFLFTILIAVGEDYNIFLLARVQEEEKRCGPVCGVTQALTRTGPIISSCGVIMAGTFGTLLAGSLSEMKQLGFALAFGVLLDTFVVRPLLVPAFLLLLDAGRLRLLNWLDRRRGTPGAVRAGSVSDGKALGHR